MRRSKTVYGYATSFMNRIIINGDKTVEYRIKRKVRDTFDGIKKPRLPYSVSCGLSVIGFKRDDIMYAEFGGQNERSRL